jgi:hypothetical protein
MDPTYEELFGGESRLALAALSLARGLCEPSLRAMTLQEFVAKYTPTPPRRPHANNDELRQLGPADGMLLMGASPAAGLQGHPDQDETRQLWVFRAPNPVDIPYVLERSPNVTATLATGKAKHTNLTGGGSASCGGEFWIDVSDRARMYVNGNSGRYGPTSREQLEDAEQVFRGLGFDVRSYGWDEETHKPHVRYFR